ncbi:nitrous oxide reductase accessory protein NosL [Bordetella petrii]|uniref:nitrous oxide reductase accessory protein NosL n=1 Tax=Bordetella petrii TaxID=94624 RepID=UPI001E4A94BB|nr:nitrous oxide reductase accessory protein NosL [Bordetella petrii]MCD0503669.1 nitrous oxide reductase accessory protein NosL [Bordetella petrii]
MTRLPSPRALARPLFGALLLATLAACGEPGQAGAPPAPHALDTDAVGHYCGMALNEHNGPKGQLFLAGQQQPVWFSAIKQVFAYTLLPEEPKTITAIYVNDMAGAEAGLPPNPHAWIDARRAYYVIESRYIGGMGAEDALPFAQRAQANAFAQRHGGLVAAFDDVPESYVFSQASAPPPTGPAS